MTNLDEKYPISYSILARLRAPRKKDGRYGIERLDLSVIDGGEIRGPSLLIPGKKTAEVAQSVYREAKKLGVDVALRAVPDGDRVYRIDKEELKKYKRS